MWRGLTSNTQDMASEERKAGDKKIQEENFFKSLSAAEKQAETDAFQCSRCKQRKCLYRQQQTRSADEPMTVRLSSPSPLLPFFFCPFFCIPFGENNANDIIFISDIRHVRTSLSTPLRAMYSLSLLLTTAAQFAKTSTSYFILTQGHHLTLTILQVEILIGSPSHPSHSRRRPLLPVVCSASSLFYTCPSALFNTWLLPLYAPHRTNKPPVLPISFHPPAA